MGKTYLTALLVCLLCLNLYAKNNAKDALRYEIQAVGGTQNSSTIVHVSVWSKKKENVDADMFARAAVHGILFRGATKAGSSMASGYTVPALMKSPNSEAEFSEFFVPFFSEGRYNGYVRCMEDSRRVIKIGKEYRVSCDVVVSRNVLRDDLVSAGVLKDLKQGW